jgi:hypothetical protein
VEEGVKVTRVDEQTVAIGPLDLFSTELLHQIHLCANPEGSPDAHARLYPSPTGGRDPELDSEWRDYVEPELADMFATSIEVIQRDIAGFPPARPAADHHTLHLPIKNLEAWIHGLNQARLALAARHGFTEQDIDGPLPMEGDVRALALFQMHFYGWLQECFLRVLRDD